MASACDRRSVVVVINEDADFLNQPSTAVACIFTKRQDAEAYIKGKPWLSFLERYVW